MAASPTRTPMGISYFTQNHLSFIDWALALSSKFLLPLVFYTLLIISGTLSIIYTFYVHQRVPRNFILGLSITFGLVLILTAAILTLIRIRRFNRRRVTVDKEANRAGKASNTEKIRSKSKGRSPHQGNDEQALPVEPDSVYELNPRGSQLPSSSRARQSNPSELPYRSFQPPVQSRQGSLAEGLSSNPPSAISSPTTSAKLKEPGVVNTSSDPTNFPRRTLRGSDRLMTMESPRRQGPPSTRDISAYHLPIYDSPANLSPSMNTTRRSIDRKGRV